MSRGSPACHLAAIGTVGCQPCYTVELFKKASLGREEEGTLGASPVISTTTINPSTAALCMQLEQDSCMVCSPATAPSVG